LISLLHFNGTDYDCPFDCFIDILKGKWRTTILLLLAKKPLYFSALQKSIPEISAKVLAANLQLLEKNHILHRIVYETKPPTVEYSLSEEGIELIAIMNKINDWTAVYFAQAPNDK
jgi:DNA-binding HxlR family transcriptional regulator